MIFWDTQETKAFCDNTEGHDGCGAASYLLPEEYKEQFCSQCGKKTKIIQWQSGVEITCPNGHDFIERNHKHCIICGEKLTTKPKELTKVIKE